MVFGRWWSLVIVGVEEKVLTSGRRFPLCWSLAPFMDEAAAWIGREVKTGEGPFLKVSRSCMGASPSFYSAVVCCYPKSPVAEVEMLWSWRWVDTRV